MLHRILGFPANSRVKCLYGLPIRPGALPLLLRLSGILKITLMIDCEEHIKVIEKFNSQNISASPWGVFIKVNVGSNRAGAPVNSQRLKDLTLKAAASPALSIIGFYCHAGHSYACRTEDQAEAVLHDEINGTLEAALSLPVNDDIIISVGSTPTAHVMDKLKSSLPPNIKLELHAGRN